MMEGVETATDDPYLKIFENLFSSTGEVLENSSDSFSRLSTLYLTAVLSIATTPLPSSLDSIHHKRFSHAVKIINETLTYLLDKLFTAIPNTSLDTHSLSHSQILSIVHLLHLNNNNNTLHASEVIEIQSSSLKMGVDSANETQCIPNDAMSIVYNKIMQIGKFSIFEDILFNIFDYCCDNAADSTSWKGQYLDSTCSWLQYCIQNLEMNNNIKFNRSILLQKLINSLQAYQTIIVPHCKHVFLLFQEVAFPKHEHAGLCQSDLDLPLTISEIVMQALFRSLDNDRNGQNEWNNAQTIDVSENKISSFTQAVITTIQQLCTHSSGKHLPIIRSIFLINDKLLYSIAEILQLMIWTKSSTTLEVFVNVNLNKQILFTDLLTILTKIVTTTEAKTALVANTAMCQTMITVLGSGKLSQENMKTLLQFIWSLTLNNPIHQQAFTRLPNCSEVLMILLQRMIETSNTISGIEQTIERLVLVIWTLSNELNIDQIGNCFILLFDVMSKFPKESKIVSYILGAIYGFCQQTNTTNLHQVQQVSSLIDKFGFILTRHNRTVTVMKQLLRLIQLIIQNNTKLIVEFSESSLFKQFVFELINVSHNNVDIIPLICNIITSCCNIDNNLIKSIQSLWYREFHKLFCTQLQHTNDPKLPIFIAILQTMVALLRDNMELRIKFNNETIWCETIFKHILLFTTSVELRMQIIELIKILTAKFFEMTKNGNACSKYLQSLFMMAEIWQNECDYLIAMFQFCKQCIGAVVFRKIFIATIRIDEVTLCLTLLTKYPNDKKMIQLITLIIEQADIIDGKPLKLSKALIKQGFDTLFQLLHNYFDDVEITGDYQVCGSIQNMINSLMRVTASEERLINRVSDTTYMVHVLRLCVHRITSDPPPVHFKWILALLDVLLIGMFTVIAPRHKISKDKHFWLDEEFPILIMKCLNIDDSAYNDLKLLPNEKYIKSSRVTSRDTSLGSAMVIFTLCESNAILQLDTFMELPNNLGYINFFGALRKMTGIPQFVHLLTIVLEYIALHIKDVTIIGKLHSSPFCAEGLPKGVIGFKATEEDGLDEGEVEDNRLNGCKILWAMMHNDKIPDSVVIRKEVLAMSGGMEILMEFWTEEYDTTMVAGGAQLLDILVKDDYVTLTTMPLEALQGKLLVGQRIAVAISARDNTFDNILTEIQHFEKVPMMVIIILKAIALVTYSLSLQSEVLKEYEFYHVNFSRLMKLLKRCLDLHTNHEEIVLVILTTMKFWKRQYLILALEGGVGDTKPKSIYYNLMSIVNRL